MPPTPLAPSSPGRWEYSSTQLGYHYTKDRALLREAVAAVQQQLLQQREEQEEHHGDAMQ
jgi:hypothetical protein